MITYSLAILFEANTEIVKFRNAHGQADTPAHITIIYPTEIDARDHIKEILRNYKPFTLTLNKTAQSAKDHYLYLLVKPDTLINMHKQLHTGPLKDHNNPDMPIYIPHLTLGVFSSQQELDKHKQEFTQELSVDTIHLLTFKDDKLIHKEPIRL